LLFFKEDIMEGPRKDGRGGKREGSGRPKGTTRGINHPYKNVTLAFEESDLEEMRKRAKESGKSFSRFLRDKALNV
jgi:hypothetical protein